MTGRASEDSTLPLRPASAWSISDDSNSTTSTAPTSSTRGRPRRRSPAAMYSYYDTPAPKPPKPLVKLNKKKNSAETPSAAFSSESPFSPTTAALTTVSALFKRRGRSPTRTVLRPANLEDSDRSNASAKSESDAGDSPTGIVSEMQQVASGPIVTYRRVDQVIEDSKSSPTDLIDYPALSSMILENELLPVSATDADSGEDKIPGEALEKDWEGGWNEKNMQTVISKLRLLK
ncbi:hypothetical protein R3P38DRAFT_1798856 [Favolaschia claudopus]|uniref:Uncharacterized protein n=1 Tax=Favolaschia claudopus TaxID=2862362 RepID=A0AAW0A5W9_9AGAR